MVLVNAILVAASVGSSICPRECTYGKGPCKAQVGNPVVCEQLNEDALCSVGYTDCSEEIGLGNAISECTSNFNAQDSSCAAVIELGHCYANAGIDTLPAEDSFRAMAEQTLVMAQKNEAGCTEHADASSSGTAQMRTKRGDVQFDVHEGKDVKVFRFRREVVSLFSVSDRLNQVESSDKKMDSDIKSLSERITDTVADVNQKLADSELNVEKKLAASEDSVQEIKAQVSVMLKDANDTNNKVTDELRKQNEQLKSDLTSTIAAMPKQYLIGYKSCNWDYSDGSDGDVIYMRCNYVKKRDDTMLEIYQISSHRCINCYSWWEIRVDGQSARCKKDNSSRCALRGAIHMRSHSWVDFHLPFHVGGFFEKPANADTVKKGKRQVQMFRASTWGGDKYVGWSMPSRLIIKEIDTSLYQYAQCDNWRVACD